MNLLEVGCGNALLWLENIDRIPPNTELHLTDFSSGMIQSAERQLLDYKDLLCKRGIKITFEKADANNLNLCGNYDIIVANHMLYHVTNKHDFFFKVKKMLKYGGHFCCTTIGENHMHELNELLNGFCPELYSPFDSIISGQFTLENGFELLSGFFDTISIEKYNCDLIVDDAKVIYDYLYSYPNGVKECLNKRGGELLQLINRIIECDGAMHIQKSQGIFVCS